MIPSGDVLSDFANIPVAAGVGAGWVVIGQ
jgi:hypothetical protein